MVTSMAQKNTRIFLSIVALMVALPASAVDNPVENTYLTVSLRGPARVVDGDTVAIGKIRFRLFGMDAPEIKGPGGKYVSGALKVLVGVPGGEIQCTIMANGKKFGRPVVLCVTRLDQDVSLEMLARGYARVDDRFKPEPPAEYYRAEMAARAARRGLWRCKLNAPASWQLVKKDWCSTKQ